MTDYYQKKLEEGLTYQDFVMEKLYEVGIPLISYSSKKYQVERGENKAGIEIKNDQRFRETGNFYIELAEKSWEGSKKYVSSGIQRDDNTWLYVIGDYETIFIFGKRQLQCMANKFRQVQTPTSIGYLLPVDYAKQFLALKIIECNENAIEAVF